MHGLKANGYFAIGAIGMLFLLRLLRLLVSVLLLLKLCGPVVATLGLAAVLLFRLNWLVRAGALAGAVLVWHWPVLAALVFSAPRLFTMLPGVISTLLARARHPPPVWEPRSVTLAPPHRAP